MKKIFGLLASALMYFCVATVISLVAAGTALWAKGALDADRMYRVLAALHGRDLLMLHDKLNKETDPVKSEQPPFTAQQEASLFKSLDLDLREIAIKNGVADLSQLQQTLQTEQTRFTALTQSYEQRLEQLEKKEQASSLSELQRTLESMKAKQAKDQLLKMIDDDAMIDVVAVFRKMSNDTRKKILAEFKDSADAEQLYEILKNIREGEPLASEIKAARKKLQQVAPRASTTEKP